MSIDLDTALKYQAILADQKDLDGLVVDPADWDLTNPQDVKHFIEEVECDVRTYLDDLSCEMETAQWDYEDLTTALTDARDQLEDLEIAIEDMESREFDTEARVMRTEQTFMEAKKLFPEVNY